MRITIDNEEVLTDKSFTINEEMLNTSSVILNNVFPKTWEQDKDYVSRFYYPKDYSKCLIVNTPRENKTETRTGSNFQFDIDSPTRYITDFNIEGNTEQQGTPTPTSPQEVKVVKGESLLDFSNYTSISGTGTTFSFTNDILTVSNTTGTYNQVYYDILNLAKANSGKTIRLDIDSATFTGSSTRVDLMIINNGTTSYQKLIETNGTVNNYTIPSDTTNLTRVWLRIISNNSNTSQSGSVVLNKPILHFGSGKIDYLPYNTVGIKKQNKNLFDKNKADVVVGYINGTTGEVVLGGTSKATREYIPILPNTSMNVSGFNNIVLAFYRKDKSFIERVLTGSSSYTFNRDAYYIRIQGLSDVFDADKIQLEKGNQATSYVEHKETIYPLTLEGKNLLNKSTVVEGYLNGSGEVVYNTTYRVSDYIDISGTNYITISGNYGGSEINCFYNENKTYLSSFNMITNKTKTQEVPNNAKYIRCTINASLLNTYRLEKGTTIFPNFLGKIGTYQDRIYRTSGKNLIYKSIDINTISQNGKIEGYSEVKVNVAKVESGKTYTYSSSTTEYIVIGFFVEEPIVGSTTYNGSREVYYVSTQTFTVPNGCNYVGIRSGLNITPMLNEGTSSLPYEPYGTGEWYLHNEIGKVVLNGASSESWSILNVSARTFKLSNFENGNGTDTQTNYPILSSHFLSNKQAMVYSGTIGIQALGGTTKALYICFGSSSSTSDVSALRTWLSTHNTEVYYVLATPQEIKIEGTLKGQLENLWNMVFYDGQNNFSQIMALETNMTMSVYLDYDELLFCGVVENTGEISLNPRYPHYCNLQVLDFKTFLSEGETLDFVIANKTILEAIEQVVDAISEYGFVLGNVNILGVNDTIGAYSTKDKTAYDVFNYIADITQSRWTTRLIDENTVAIDFYDPSLMPQGTAIEYTNEWFTNNNIINMTFNYSSRDYRNKQVMTSSEVFGSVGQSETKITDGYNTQFMTEQKIGNINSIYVNGVEKTYATNTDKSRGISADFYYKVGDNYFTSDATLNVGSQISINYTPIVEGRQVITNQAEITRVANTTGRKGIIARYEDRNDAITSTELQKIGQSYIKYKGTAEINLRVETYKNIWNVGDRVSFTSPLEELTTEYMVRSKQINYILTQDKIFYTYELTSSFNSETAINYFDNQRSKAKGNIGEGEYISRNVDVENEGNIIFYDFTATQITITGNNQLASPLSSPLID